MVLLGELVWENNEDEDGFHEKDVNICLLLVQITMCLGMAWEGEDKERASKDQARVKGKRQLRRRWTMTVVNKRVLALSLGSNQVMGSHIMRGIKSLLDFMEEVTWCYKVWTHMVRNGWSHILKVNLLKKFTQSWLHLILKEYVNNGIKYYWNLKRLI